MTRLILMRHGKTTYKDGGVFAGITNFPLDKEGAEMAKDIAKTLKDEKITAVYSSMLTRSYDTAKPIADQFNLSVEKTKEFNELDFGIFEGLPLDKVKERFSDVLEKRNENKWEFVIPQGESYKEGAERSYSKLLELIKKHDGQTFVVICHGCIIKALLVMLTGKTFAQVSGKNYHFGCRVFINIDGKNVKIEKTEGIDDGLSEIA